MWKTRRKPQPRYVGFIDIRDTSGRQSGFNVHPDEGLVTVRGALEHNAEFTVDEFRLLAKQIETILDTSD
jgi:hypothetical protein